MNAITGIGLLVVIGLQLKILHKLNRPPGPTPDGGFLIMSKFKLPADQQDFEIEVTATGAADSEGNPAGAGDVDLSVESTNPDAIDATVTSQTVSDDGNSVTAKLSVHVGSPDPDFAVLGYKASNRDTGKLLGTGSDEFLIGVGEADSIASITSTVPFTPETDEPPPAPPV